MADSETGRILGDFNEKAGPLPVWAWGAIATAGLFAFEWWRNRQSTGTAGNPTGNPTGDAPPADGGTTPPTKPPKAPRHEPHQPPHHSHGKHSESQLQSQMAEADFPTTLGGIQSMMESN